MPDRGAQPDFDVCTVMPNGISCRENRMLYHAEWCPACSEVGADKPNGLDVYPRACCMGTAVVERLTIVSYLRGQGFEQLADEIKKEHHYD